MKKFVRQNKVKGFTLLEVLVVLLISVLALRISVPMKHAQTQSSEAFCIKQMEEVFNNSQLKSLQREKQQIQFLENEVHILKERKIPCHFTSNFPKDTLEYTSKGTIRRGGSVCNSLGCFRFTPGIGGYRFEARI